WFEDELRFMPCADRSLAYLPRGHGAALRLVAAAWTSRHSSGTVAGDDGRIVLAAPEYKRPGLGEGGRGELGGLRSGESGREVEALEGGAADPGLEGVIERESARVDQRDATGP